MMRWISHGALKSVESVVVDERVGVALSDGAHVLSSGDLEVSLVSPVGSPRVLHVPEVSSVLGSVTGGQDGVVDVHGGGSAVLHGVDTGDVVLEAGDDLEGDGDGAGSVESFGKLDLITLGDVEAAVSDVSDGDGSSEDACSVLGGVGVGDVTLDTSGVADVFESVGGETALAAVVVEVTGAVDQLLFGEGHILSLSEDVPVGLKRADGGEGPARSAGSLVLDGADHSEVVPLVEVGDGLSLDFLLDLEGVGGRALLGSHKSLLLELLEAHVGEIVDSLFPGVGSHVVVTDLEEGLKEDLEAGIGLDGVGAVELVVDALGSHLAEEALAVQELPVLDVQVQVADRQRDQSSHEQDF